ncbi:hypothetical protein CRG98_008163 [Punica granatum]|uniref:Uncharacterized protein n=1 Tax=Punica granatum TaxID=22663 RepID=A0A2I0KT29_PUNGR|nr:hypothetical protein CRG98_008163 [Punica granatum]
MLMQKPLSRQPSRLPPQPPATPLPPLYNPQCRPDQTTVDRQIILRLSDSKQKASARQSVSGSSYLEREMADEYGCGIGSVVMILVVAAVLFLLPLGMGPLQPPGYSLLIFPVVLIVIFIFLSQASK